MASTNLEVLLGPSTIGEATTAAVSQAESQAAAPPPTSNDAASSTTCGRQQQELNHKESIRTSPSFKGSKIWGSIDVSASTYGDILDAEISATQAICKLIPSKLRPSSKIVPWSHQCGDPIDLQQANRLQSEGGTDPNVFLDDAASRDFLQEADFWFLVTDGEINNSDVRRFTRGIRGYGLHGKACIICLFGEGDEKPMDGIDSFPICKLQTRQGKARQPKAKRRSQGAAHSRFTVLIVSGFQPPTSHLLTSSTLITFEGYNLKKVEKKSSESVIAAILDPFLIVRKLPI